MEAKLGTQVMHKTGTQVMHKTGTQVMHKTGTQVMHKTGSACNENICAEHWTVPHQFLKAIDQY